MAQTAAERRSAQRELARNLSEGKRAFPQSLTGKTKAATVLGYTKSEWQAFSPEERKDLRNEVKNAQARINRFAHRSDRNREPGDPRDDWETWEWDLYREAVGL
jgi:hypothetical protein